MEAKDAIIKEVYYDSGALGSIKRTLQDAQQINPDIKEKDVKSWKDRNIQKKINLRGFNSFIASEPKEEYQMDLFEMPVKRYKDARKMSTQEKAEHQRQMEQERNARRRVKRRPGEGVRRGVWTCVCTGLRACGVGMPRDVCVCVRVCVWWVD